MPRSRPISRGSHPGTSGNGVQVGKTVAAAVLAWRANDRFASANPQPPAFLPSTLPGIWRQTTAGAAGAAQFSRLGDVEPFGLLSSTQFLPLPQPQLESDAIRARFQRGQGRWAQAAQPVVDRQARLQREAEDRVAVGGRRSFGRRCHTVRQCDLCLPRVAQRRSRRSASRLLVVGSNGAAVRAAQRLRYSTASRRRTRASSSIVCGGPKRRSVRLPPTWTMTIPLLSRMLVGCRSWALPRTPRTRAT